MIELMLKILETTELSSKSPEEIKILKGKYKKPKSFRDVRNQLKYK